MSGPKFGAGDWQCLQCGRTFSMEITELPPIECPKCGGEAVKLRYHRCQACGKKVVISRLRLTEKGQAQREAMRKQAEAAGGSAAGPPGPMMPPMESQYRLKQSDGGYGWSPWVSRLRSLRSVGSVPNVGKNCLSSPHAGRPTAEAWPAEVPGDQLH
ncbi:MAG: hypothetical protein GWP14_08990 [Actinobacteria bacterium]|nr:hypothetical protein [Actinomycetota bacterium]